MISLLEHTVAEDGAHTVVLGIGGPLTVPAVEMLPELAELVEDLAGGDALVTWHFGALMAPPDPVAFAVEVLVRAIGRWATGYVAAPVDMTGFGLEST